MPAVVAMPEFRRLIAFDQLPTKSNLKDALVTFYRNDEKLIRVWRNPKAQIAKLGRARGVISPDFSVYIDMARHERGPRHQRRETHHRSGHHGRAGSDC